MRGRIAGPAIGGTMLKRIWGIGGCFLIGALPCTLPPFSPLFSSAIATPVRTQSGGFFLGNIQAAIRLSLREKPLAGYFVVTVIPICSACRILLQSRAR